MRMFIYFITGFLLAIIVAGTRGAANVATILALFGLAIAFVWLTTDHRGGRGW